MATDEYRMVLIVRMDLKMGKGKACAQCGHATLGAYKNAMQSDPYGTTEWYNSAAAKIVLKVADEDELLELSRLAAQSKLPYYLVTDAGRTQIPAGSKTILAIGPARYSVISPITGHLKLY